MKELDASLAARISDLEQVKNQLENQLSRLMQEQSNAEDAHRAELATLKAQLATEEHRVSSGEGAALLFMPGGGVLSGEDVAKIRTQAQESERELQDLQCAHDRDKALWEGKAQFLEQQKEHYKRELSEAQRKFELTLQQI